MSESQNLFGEFPPLTREKWEKRIQKELKGSAPETLHWPLAEEIEMRPFYQPAADSLPSPLNGQSTHNHWAIGEDFDVTAPAVTNRALLEGLLNGLEAPLFRWPASNTDFQLPRLLAEVRADYIQIHLRSPSRPVALLQQFAQHQAAEGLDLVELEGSINGYFLRFPDLDLTLLRDLSEQLPRFRWLHLSAPRPQASPDAAVADLVELLHQLCDNLVRARTLGWEPAALADKIVVDLHLGTSYLVELAKIRAWHLLWPLLWEGFGVSAPPPAAVHAYLAPDTQIEDQDLNMIRTTTQAMAAVIGGVRRLSLLPADAFGGDSTPFTRRMARNVQHLLRMESYLDRVVDPAAGSYYLETLTEQLAERAWRQFQSEHR